MTAEEVFYVLLSESAIERVMGAKDYYEGNLPRVSGKALHSTSLGNGVLAFGTGTEHPDEFLALVAVDALRSLPNEPQAIYARIYRVLKAAGRPPIHLPRGWSEFHFKNRLAFFAVPETGGAQRWAAEVDGDESIVRFLEVTTSDRSGLNLATWSVPTCPKIGKTYRVWAKTLLPSAADSSDGETFAEKVDLQIIGSDAVVQGLTYDDWLSKLDALQKKVVEAPTSSSIRVMGPAGSGKTLALCMRAIHLSRDSVVISGRLKILVVTHSWAMTERIDGVLTALGGGHVPDSILVLPLLYVLQLHTGFSGQGTSSVLGEDSSDGRVKVVEMISRILSDSNFIESTESKRTLSPHVLGGLDARAGSHARNELVIDLYDEIVGVISSQNILAGDTERIAEYISAVRDDTLPPFKTSSDRDFCLKVFRRLLDMLVDIGSITTDQLVLDSIRTLETFTWNVRRETEGYDFILVDELQLFDEQERLALSLLSRSEGLVFMSVEDPSQGMFSALNDRHSRMAATKPIYLESTHRFRPKLFDFIRFLYSKFAFNAPPIKVAQTDSKAQQRPQLFKFSTAGEAQGWCADRASEIAALNEKGRRVCIVSLSSIEEGLYNALKERCAAPVVWLRGYDDVEQLSYQKRAVVLSSWQFIGGTQFSDVILVVAGLARPTTAYAKLREMTGIYLGASRAMSNLDIVCDMRVPTILEQAVKQKLVVEGGRKAASTGIAKTSRQKK